eukprot:s1436_g10.t1
MFGGEYRKPIGWLTNAPHLQCIEKRCPGEPGHNHPALVGLVEDFKSNVVWKTYLAAEYPEGLFDTLAAEYQRCLKELGARQEMEVVLTKEGDKQNRPDSQVWQREVENSECIGGMRHPTLSVLRVSGLRGVGANLFWFLDQLQFEYKRLNELVQCVGGNGNSEVDALTTHLQIEFAKYLCIPCSDQSFGLWAEVDEEQFLTERSRLETTAGLVGAEGNYMSDDENKADADELFIKEMENGYVDWSTDLRSLEQKYGPLVQSSIGVIVKYKKGVKKVRLAHDLRRSCVNDTICFAERLVLPRLRDVVEDAMVLFEALEPGEQVMLLSLDFRDAFKQLPVRDSEKRFLSGMAAGGYFVYHVVLFGVRTGPLVWARMAAMVSRFTQAMFAHDRCRLQVYVDDPLILMRGKPSQVEDMTNKILCLWVTMGLKISWSKGTLGQAVEWIGAQLELDNSQKLLRLTVTSEKLEEWKALLSRLDTKPMVSRKLLTQFTGKMGWAAGFLIQLRPFVRMLHTALSVKSKVSEKGVVRVVGDAEGVLSALIKRSAKAPLLNAVVREITFLLARNFQALETVHVWSEYNEWADALSDAKVGDGFGQMAFSQQLAFGNDQPSTALKFATREQGQLAHWQMRASAIELDHDEDEPEVIEDAERQGEADGKEAWEKFRKEQPNVKEYARGSSQKLQEVMKDEALLVKAMEEFQNEKYANSNKASQESRAKWWPDKAEALGLKSYPLTLEKIDTLGSLLKVGQYRSSALYFSAAKQSHVHLGFPWSAQLEQASKDALRSCVRGLGPDRRCPALDLMKVFELSDLDPCHGGPRFPRETVIVFAHFACREIEASCRTRADISFEDGDRCGTVSLWLPASKADPKGNGVLRRHGCTCAVDTKRCPVKAARRIYDYGTSQGAKESDPFLSTEGVTIAPTKSSMVETFRLVARALNWKDEEIRAMTGHTLRASGAQYLARCGIEYYKIQLFCRWGTDTVLRYLREAPLEDSELWLTHSMKRDSLNEVMCQTALKLNNDKRNVSDKDGERIVAAALETRATAILSAVETTKDDIQEIVDSLLKTKIKMDDHWAGELSRRFLPKYVINLSSKKCHAVRDSQCTGCGFEWRNTKDHDLCYELGNDANRCEAPGCQKLFKRFEL